MTYGHGARTRRRTVVAAPAGAVLGAGVLAAAPAPAATAPRVPAQGAYAFHPATGESLFGTAPDGRLRTGSPRTGGNPGASRSAGR